MFQDIKSFKLPKNFRGRSAVVVQIWWACQSVLFKLSPQFAYKWRAFLLRIFGAKIGQGVIIRPSVTITYPWNLVIEDYVWVGDDVVLYTLGNIFIGCNTVVSQRSYLCAGDHDYRDPSFPIRSRPISIGEEVWLGTDVFVGPGVQIGKGAVVGARSSVFKNVKPAAVCMGNPCVSVKERNF